MDVFSSLHELMFFSLFINLYLLSSHTYSLYLCSHTSHTTSHTSQTYFRYTHHPDDLIGAKRVGPDHCDTGDSTSLRLLLIGIMRDHEVILNPNNEDGLVRQGDYAIVMGEDLEACDLITLEQVGGRDCARLPTDC